ncbi:MAG: toll/interleukin-1 receptor domain-containing protein [Xenococcaceae cyanobacterium]
MVESNQKSYEFDVFLAHNSVDKPKIRAIAKKLKQRGLKPWLDEEQIAPGELFQDAIQKAIPQIKSAAICIGSNEIGQWQRIELPTLISQFVNEDILVIPVLLPGVDRIPGYLLFLQQLNWVNFQNIDDAAALDRLEWAGLFHSE